MLLLHSVFTSPSSPRYARSYSKLMGTVGVGYFPGLLSADLSSARKYWSHMSNNILNSNKNHTSQQDKMTTTTYSCKKFTQTDMKTESHNNLQITQSFSDILRYNHLYKTFRLLLLHGFLDGSSSNFSLLLVAVEVTLNHRTHQCQTFT